MEVLRGIARCLIIWLAVVSVIEPYGDKSSIASIRRLRLQDTDAAQYPDPNVAVEIVFRDGSRDLLVAADVENPLGLERPSPKRAASCCSRSGNFNLPVNCVWCAKTKPGSQNESSSARPALWQSTT
jgi:hypothetical protein